MENQQLALDGLGSCGTPYQAVPELLRHHILRDLRFVSPPHSSSPSQLQRCEDNFELKLVKRKYAKDIYAQSCSQRYPAS